MLKLMDKESDEYRCLTEAIVSVEKVANYINEMQMISETYTPRFEKLCEAVEGVEVSILGDFRLSFAPLNEVSPYF